MAWWEIVAAQTDHSHRAVAYYRHSAQDRQENSIPIQREQVQAWAKDNGLQIIQEFADAGKSGLTAEHRPAFNDLMNNWVKKRHDFAYVLCLDVSRFGRFQDIDLSAQYSAECRRHGKQVIYTALGKPRDNDPLYPVYVQFERFRAAQYSRELSDKVWRGCIKIAEQGYWAGGSPPYGLQRLLLDEIRQPVQVLEAGQRKGIQNQRVTLAEGPAEEVAVICRLFHEFVDLGYDEERIAAGTTKVPQNHYSPQRVLQAIRQRCMNRCSLVGERVRRTHPQLFTAAWEHFGGWLQAVQAAGVAHTQVEEMQPQKRDKQQLAAALRAWEAAGHSLRWCDICWQNHHLATVARNTFKHWKKALVATGLVTAAQLAGRTKIRDQPAIIQAFQQRQLRGQPLAEATVYAEDVMLVWAARRFFGSWEQALTAAGVRAQAAPE